MRIWIVLCVVVVSAVSTPPSVHAQATTDILSQHVEADLSAVTPHIVTTARLVATATTSTMYLIAPSFPTSTVTIAGEVVTLEIVPGTGDVVVSAVLGTPIAAGTEFDVVLDLSGVPTCARSGAAVCAFRAEEVVLLPATMGVGWHLVGLFGPDPFVTSALVRAPAALDVVAGQGMPSSVVDDGADRIWTYDEALPFESWPLWARRADRFSSESGRVVGLLGAGDTVRAAAMSHAVEIADGVIPVYERLFGALDVDEFHLLCGSDTYAFGAIGLLGNVFFPQFILEDRFSYLVEQGMAHEVGHTWWGGLASADTASSAEGAFLQESFAEYSAWRALGELQGDQARTSGVRMNAVWYMLGRPDERDVAPLSASPSDALFIFAIYHKGSVFLRTVEEHVGEAPFTEALRSLVARGPGHHTIDGFVSAVQTASGIDVTPLLNDWMRAPGYPSLTVSPSIAGQELSLTIAMDESFDLDVPVRVRLADGSETWTTVALTPGVSTTTMPFAGTLASVEVDPRWTMSRRVVPALRGDVSLDGRVDGADLIEVALRSGGAMPDTRRVDGHYDPLYDVDGDLAIGDADLDAIIEAAR